MAKLKELVGVVGVSVSSPQRKRDEARRWLKSHHRAQ